MSTQKLQLQAWDDFCKLALGVFKHSVAVLCSRDVENEHFMGLETHEWDEDKRPGTVGMTREQAHELDGWLYGIGEPRCNVVPSAHAAELAWLNDQPCACRFSRLAEVLGEKPEDLRKHIVKHLLQPQAPKGVYFTITGPLALVGMRGVAA
jgi:hypothetical protein